MALGHGRTGTNNFAVSKFIVDTNGIQNGATHSTITAALSDASSGQTIFVRPGTYDEDFTISTAGITITATPGDGDNGITIIRGKITYNVTGTSSISNIRLETDGDYCFEDTGSASGSCVFTNCFFQMDDNNLININNSNRSLTFRQCQYNVTFATGVLFTLTAVSQVLLTFCRSFGNQTPGTNTVAAGALFITNSDMQRFPISVSGAGYVQAYNTSFELNGQNITQLTTAGTGTSMLKECVIRTGTATALTVGSGTTLIANSLEINSSNATVIGGAGTLIYADVSFLSTGNVISGPTITARTFSFANAKGLLLDVDNVRVNGNTISTTDTNGDLVLAADGTGIVDSTAQDIHAEGISFDAGSNVLDVYVTGTWTPTVDGSTGSPTVTYTTQSGQYTRIGNVVHVKATIQINTFSGGSGNLYLGGLPYTVSTTNGSAIGSIRYQGLDIAASVLDVVIRADLNATNVRVFECLDNAASSVVPVTALAAGDVIDWSLTYWV